MSVCECESAPCCQRPSPAVLSPPGGHSLLTVLSLLSPRPPGCAEAPSGPLAPASVQVGIALSRGCSPGCALAGSRTQHPLS